MILLAGLIFFKAEGTLSTSCCAGPPAAKDACAICGLEVLRDAPEVDNEVRLEREGKKKTYRCVLCALADVKESKGDLTIITPSDKKGKPVKILRTDGKWTMEPETATFAYIKGSHAQCEIRYRAVLAKADFDTYLQTNPKVLRDAKSISLAELIKRSE